MLNVTIYQVSSDYHLIAFLCECKWQQCDWGSVGAHQQLWGAQFVQAEGLDAGVVHPHLPVDPRALNACQDA